MTSLPPARRDDVVDHLHGVEVADPYRWLEDGDRTEVQAWVAAQNARTRAALDGRLDRARWHERLVALMQRPVVMAVQLRGDRLFCVERPAGTEQFVLTRRSALDPAAPPVVLLDPAVGVADAAGAIDWFEASPDGSLIAVGTSEGGSEDSVLSVIDAVDGNDRGEHIPGTRACSVAWEPDGAGFAYTRYPQGEQYHRTVHHHLLGTPWRDDPVMWAEHPNAQAWPDVTISPDGAWLLVHVLVGWARYDVHLLERATGTWTTVIAELEVTTAFEFAADGASLVGVTTLDAPKGRVVRAAFSAPQSDRWETLIPEGDAVLGRVAVRGDDLLVVSTTRAVDRVERFAPDGRRLGEVDGLGDVIAVGGLSADRETGEAFAVVDSFQAPTSLWRIPVGSAPAVAWSAVGDDDDVIPAMQVSQVTYPSLDGTPIGLFLVHRADVTPGIDVPAILNGYGGFAIAETPVWSPQIAAWCAAGGTYAIAGLRGGIEEGEAWHQAGRRGRKQNVFDDFHAGADWIVTTGLASRDRLGVVGRSNGGLLVGVAMTQRPDLCRAVLCGVPLLDMVRFPQFLIAKLWTDEYGDPDVADEFAWLHAYSPYHHVVDGTCYPATLFATAEGDTRVDPLHARKMAALVQAASSCQDERPILLFQEARAGHGVGKPVSKRADELADGLTFLAWQLGLGAGVSARAEWLVVGGSPEPWERLGLAVVDGTVPLFGTGLRFDRSAPAGIARWALSGVGEDVTDIDGLATDVIAPATPVLVEHPCAAIGLDHVVVTTDDLERTCAAIEAATGAPLRRVREVGEIRQGFHRLGGGGLIVEVVERAGLPVAPAWFWGLVINVEDLDVAAERIGPEAIGAVTPAVQPGRRIATVRAELGLGVPVALMTP